MGWHSCIKEQKIGKPDLIYLRMIWRKDQQKMKYKMDSKNKKIKYKIWLMLKERSLQNQFKT